MLSRFSCVVGLATTSVLTLSACAGGGAVPRVTQTVTQSVAASEAPNDTSLPGGVTPSPLPAIPLPTQPADPFADFEADPNSMYGVPEQKYLYALKEGINEASVTNSEIQLVVVGGAVCSGLDEANGDQDAWQAYYETLQSGGYVPPDIPANYIALAAGAALCPKHKDFVLNYFNNQFS